MAYFQGQSFVTKDLASDLKDKGFDGLFVDNLDVYYHYPSEENFDAITSILKAFKEYGFYDLRANTRDFSHEIQPFLHIYFTNYYNIS